MSPRAIAIGLVGVVLVCAVVAETELVYVQAGFLQLSPSALGGLLLLVGMRSLVGVKSRWRLLPSEMATIYGMLLIAALVGSRGLVEKMLPLLVAPNYFASPTNHWRDRFFPHIKPWLVAFDPHGGPGQSVARAYYEALRAGQPIPWQAWVVPVGAWSVLAGLVFFAFLCMASLLRRPWMEHERLAFPLAQLPLEMVREEKSALLRSPLTWIGFALPGCVYTLNGLHTFYPFVPHVEQPFSLNQFLVDPPWNAVSGMPIYISFAAVGLLYLVPGPLLFSLWFFFLLTRLQELIAASYGYEPQAMPFFPCKQFVGYQTMGAYLVLAAYILTTAAPRLRVALRNALRPPKEEPLSADELLSDRAAVVGLLLSLVGLSAWCSLAGLSFWWALIQWGVYLFVVTLVLARSTAEGGLIATEVSFRPADFYAMVSPIQTMGAANMTAMAFMDAAWFRDQRSLVLAGILDAMRVGRMTGVQRRTMIGALLSALVLSAACSILFQIWLPYRQGALEFYSYLFQGNPVWSFQFYQAQSTNPGPFHWGNALFFGVGMLVTLTLSALRSLYPWWPLHPLGYALCGSWTMILLWFPCLVTWILKGVLLRYGGMRAFVRFRPLFLGMILGEFSMAILWTAIGALAHAPAPSFPWP